MKRNNIKNIYRSFFKRIFDFILALFALPFVLCIIVIIAPFIWLEDNGPIFYAGKRIGQYGKPFGMLKFRSMKVNAPDLRLSDGSTYNGDDDPRVTRVGKFLRKTSLDEIPQFINVLVGQMSLIGPRPDPLDWIERYKPEERVFLTVKPGITGYSQAYYRNSADAQKKIDNDVYYAENISFLLDVKIIFKTVKTVLFRENLYKEVEREANHPKKLLMLGGGFLQNFVIMKAREMGYYVLCLDADPNAVGFDSANEHAVINIVDEQSCLEYARDKQVDGVLTAATDFSVLTMSYIAQELHLPGINYKSAKAIKNKAAVRRCLFDAKADDTGYSFEIDSLEQIPQILPQIHFPVMMKPCDGSGSRGASRVDKADDFEKACKYAMDGSITHRAVAEPFVVGKEYGVESFVDNGVIHILGIMQKDMTLPPYYAELGHAIPSGLSAAAEEKIRTCVFKALNALEVNHGSVNMDLLIGEGGDVHIVDVGARMGGNLIGSHIIPIGTGIDYMGNMIKAAVGDKTDWCPQSESKPVATKLLALSPGIISALPNFKEIEKLEDVIIEHHLHVGDTIMPYRTNLDGCGYVIASRCEVKEAINSAQHVKNKIDQLIQRK
jgi:lipopolysaccharide/colanic/teichoic acid biosynthesis glycosyltransferase/biotin carboxylase